jgi:hypothetical protein
MGKIVSGIGNVVSGAAKGVTQAVKAVVQPVYNATLKQIPGVDNALVGLDKAVGKAIPGGWGTVAATAASFIPGAQFGAQGLLSGITRTQLATGLGALTGSGVMKKGHEFNLQGAIMGGAMAYGASQLSQGLQDAGNVTTKSIEEAAKSGATEGVSSGIGSLSPEQLSTLTSADKGILNQLSAGIEGGAGSAMQVAPEVIEGVIPNLAGGTTAAIPGSMAAQNAYELQGLQEGFQSAYREPSMLDKIGTSISQAPKNVGNFLDKATTASTYEGLGSNTMESLRGTGSNIADAGAGIKNLASSSTYGPAAAQFATKAGLPSAGMAVMGTSGVMAIDEGIKQQAEYDAANAATRGENQEMLNRIAANKKRAQQAVLDYPYQYAMGGSVDDESGMDEARGMMQGNLQKGLFGQGYAAGGMPNLALSRMSQPAFNEGAVGGMPQFASGGQPRFLSGGGDGMSDSIKATIEGNQEARLADGEFVIPADVVSHLGNGSSKAGAKQLYSMMDRVRQARVGNKKQGREIKPKKFMPA